MTRLFDPITLRGITLRNRIGVSPMCQYSSQDGLANDWHFAHLGARAVGGAGLIIAEATAVEARGRITAHDLGLWNDDQIAPLKRITDFIRQQDAVVGIQIAHAGRKASVARPWEGGRPVSLDDGGWETVAPSALPFDAHFPAPHALTIDEIKQIQQAFVDTTRRAREAGFDWLEIHGAHGYLIHSFYSPLSNQREDEYGGSFENRTRFLMETVAVVRETWGEKPLTVRLSCSDWTEGGWTIEDSVALANRLKAAGVDLIDCSSGGNVAGARIPTEPGYQVAFSEAIRRGADIPTAAVGLITKPEHAQEIVQTGQADVVLLARAMLREPYWALHAAKALGVEANGVVPPQYLRAF